MKKIPLFDLKVSASAKREVAAVLNSGWFSTGPKVASFEKRITSLLKVPHGVAVSSATTGLQVALQAIGVGPGREVVTTPFTYVATVGAIMAVGAHPVLADISPDTLNIDPDEIDRKLSSHTGAVIPVDVAGHPADYDQLQAICNRATVPLIADAAHSIGASYHKRSIAMVADGAVLSFHATKNLTCGEGGIVLSRHQPFIEMVRLISRHGLTDTAHERRTSSGAPYDAVRPGVKAGMSELHAAVGLGQLVDYKKQQKQREKLAERYLSNLSDLNDFLEPPVVRKHCRHGWHLFIIRLHLSALKIDRDRFIDLMARRGIECGVHYRPLFDLSFYRNHLSLSPQFFPNAAYAGCRVVSLPFFPSLKLGEVDSVCDAVCAIVTRYKR